MSRIRTVKPELFRHEDLFDAELESGLQLRLAFIGLFTVADCEGRFRWKPRTLKLDVLPHDTVDFSHVLNTLVKYGFIVRYEVGGETFGWIPSFRKHQRLQTKEIEAGSTLPAYQENQEKTEYAPGTIPENSQSRTGPLPDVQEVEGNRKGIGRERNGREEARENALPTRNPASPSARSTRSKKTALPSDLGITPELQSWADKHGYGNLDLHLESFRDKAIAKGYQYVDWIAALRNAIRDDWAGLRKSQAAQGGGRAQRTEPVNPYRHPDADEFDEILRNLNRPAIEGEIIRATH